MDFSKEAIQQGRANQDASAETPENFQPTRWCRSS